MIYKIFPIYLLPEDPFVQFFNHSREMSYLSGRMTNIPGMNVVTGPVNSGKSLILMKLAEKLKAAHVPLA